LVGGRAYIGADGRNMIGESTPRSEAIWKAALNELVDFGLANSVGTSGDVFEVTSKGHEIADLNTSREA
jgi:hypothetical protein